MRNFLTCLLFFNAAESERCPEQHFAVTNDGRTLFSSCGKTLLQWNFNGEQTDPPVATQSISPSCSGESIRDPRFLRFYARAFFTHDFKNRSAENIFRSGALRRFLKIGARTANDELARRVDLAPESARREAAR